MAGINGALLMCHEHLAGALVELRESVETSSGAHRLFPRPPEACNGDEVVPTVGREHLERPLALVVLQGRVELVRPMAPTASDPHEDRCPGGAKEAHHLMEIVAAFLRLKMGDNCIADPRGPRLPGAKNCEHPPAGEATPGALRRPRLALERLVAVALARAEGPGRQAGALGPAPPASTRQGKAPQEGLVFLEHAALALTRPPLHGRQVQVRLGQGGQGWLQCAGRPTGTPRVFLNVKRTLSRPLWTPVCCANTGASSRPLHGEEREPWGSGSWSTRRLRGFARAHVTWRGRPGRGRSSKPWAPSLAKRCPHFLRAEAVQRQVGETACTGWPATTARTAGARRKTRASLVC
jgi:hypothetical protein